MPRSSAHALPTRGAETPGPPPDRMAPGALRALAKVGRTVPWSMSVVGFDGSVALLPADVVLRAGHAPPLRRRAQGAPA